MRRIPFAAMHRAAAALFFSAVLPSAHAAYADAYCGGTPTDPQYVETCSANFSTLAGSTASSSGYGSLPQGLLRATSEVTVVAPDRSGGGASVSVLLSDRIDFGNTPAFSGEIRLSVDGAFLGDVAYGQLTDMAASLVIPFVGTARIDAYVDNAGTLLRPPVDYNEGSGRTDIDSLLASNVDVELVVPFSWAPGSAPISVVAGLQTRAYLQRPGTLVADFGNTAVLSVVVPAGQTFASESGVLLATPVPEPTSAAMLLAGVALFMVRLRGSAARLS